MLAIHVHVLYIKSCSEVHILQCRSSIVYTVVVRLTQVLDMLLFLRIFWLVVFGQYLSYDTRLCWFSISWVDHAHYSS